MPFRDPEQRRAYDRERRRRLRAAGQSGTGIALSPATRLVVADGVEALLVEAVTLVRRDVRAKGTERARALGYLASVALRLIEAHHLGERLQAVEDELTLRGSPGRREA